MHRYLRTGLMGTLLAVGVMAQCLGQDTGIRDSKDNSRMKTDSWAKAKNAYHCSEAEASETCERIRPEMRAAFREGLLSTQAVATDSVRKHEGPTAQQSATATNWFPWIACGSPAVTEIVFALGCADRVVGVSDYSTYPPEARDKASIGGWANPNRERLTVLNPDIIVTQGKHETLATFAKENGIRFHNVKLDTLEDIYRAIKSIADVLSVTKRGELLVSGIKKDIEASRQNGQHRPPRRVLFLLGRSPGSLGGLTTAGSGTFLDEMITATGGTNIFSDAKGAYPQVSKESLLVRNPEVILEASIGVPSNTIERLRADWKTMDTIPAVKSGNIHYLTNDFLLIPGPRVGLAVRKLAETIYKEGSHE